MTDSPDLKPKFEAGPVWIDEAASEDGEGPLWTSEVQDAGGYSVVATVYARSEEEVIRRRDAILSALTPAVGGWVLVPKEPAEEMVDAYCRKLSELGFTTWVNLSAVWPVVLAAAPHREGVG